MSIITLMQGYRDRRRVAQAATDVARRAQSELFTKVRLRLPEMVLAEARGYIRARSARIIDTQLRALSRRQPEISADLLSVIAEQATALAIENVIDEHLRTRRGVQRRQAA